MIKQRKSSMLKSALRNYLTFFLLMAFVTTCCLMLFVTAFSKSLDVALTDKNIGVAAKLTFFNVIILSLICTVTDGIRRKFTVTKPVSQITDAAKRLVQGDFEVRVKPIESHFTDNSFNEIIDCFNTMAEELSGVETLRTDFISNVSHEIKTPLAVIKNYGTLLQSPDITDEQRIEYAKAITSSSKRLADMVTNILKLNKLENQQIYPMMEEYNLSEQLCECLLAYENIWEKENIEIDTDIEEDVMIKADAELLSLVWNNLLSNAFKFTGEGGKVRLSLKATDTHVMVNVTDTGCGMTPKTGAHIFEKFYQGDTSHASRGNGLGLALVKRVIDIMQGEISVESAVGVGSTFAVTLQRSRI